MFLFCTSFLVPFLWVISHSLSSLADLPSGPTFTFTNNTGCCDGCSNCSTCDRPGRWCRGFLSLFCSRKTDFVRKRGRWEIEEYIQKIATDDDPEEVVRSEI